MKKIFLNLIGLLFFPSVVFCQQPFQHVIDSLQLQLVKATKDTVKMNLLVALMTEYSAHQPAAGILYKDTALALANRLKSIIHIARVNDKIGRMYWQLGKFSNAYPYHFTALRLYNQAGDTPARNYVLVEIGQDYLNDTKFDEAKKYLLQSLQLSEKSGDKMNMFRTYDKLIALYENEGNFAEASKATYANLKITEELGDKELIAFATSALATNLETQGNHTEALKYYQQSLAISSTIKNPLLTAEIHRYIGDIYLGMANFVTAEHHYKQGLKVAYAMEDPPTALRFLYRGLGNVYRIEGKYAEALEYLLKGIDELKVMASNHTLASLYSETGIVYTHLKQYNRARKYFDSSNALCQKLNTTVTFADYYGGLQLLDSATGNWKAAYEHYKQYEILKDSNFNKETLRKIFASQMQYENDKKEAVLKAAQEKKDVVAAAEIRQQLRIRNYVLGVLGVLLIFAIIVYNQRNRIAREKKRSDQLVQDKELLLREIHHRVKNNLEVVSSLLALQSEQIDDPNTRELMQEGQNRVHSIGIVHQKLYQGENLSTIEMKDYFLNLGESILDSFGAEGRVQIELAMEKINVDIDTAVPLGLIVNELLTNTLKYAFPGKQQGSVRIKLEQQNGGILHLEVSDNGVGKSGLVQGTGFGAQLISLLTKQLNGSIKEEVGNGTSIFFYFKTGKAA